VSSLPLSWRAALAACLLAAALAPGSARAQEADGLAGRVERLEAQIASLQATVGRLEALVRAKPSLAPEPASAPGDDVSSRVSALETQIGALTNQIEQIGQTMSAGEATGDDAPLAITPPPVPEEPVAEEPVAEEPVAAEAVAEEVISAPQATQPAEPDVMEALREEEAPTQVVPSPRPVIPPAADNSDPSKPRWYGPKPGQSQDQDDGAPQSITPPSLATGTLPDDMPQSLAALPDANAQALYEQGYGDFLQRDYAAAEVAFNKMVKDYPDDPLAGSAQYWVGESQYVRKQYKKAADTFLATYRKYSASDKAPDTLLKLGMSLAALGQKDAACSTFKELGEKFPGAPDHIRSQAKGEAGKAGC